MTIQNIYYKRMIHIDNIKTTLTSYKKGVQSNIHNLIHPISIKNHNNLAQTIRTIVLLIPIIPGGMIGLHYYLKNIIITNNKYYSQERFKNYIQDIYGYKI